MSKYSTEFKEQILLLPDEIGVIKAAEQLEINYYAIADWKKAKEDRSSLDKTLLNEQGLAM